MNILSQMKHSLIVLASVLLMSLVSSNLVIAQNNQLACEGAQGTWDPGSMTCSFGDDTPAITGDDSVLERVTNILLFAVGAIAVLMIIINAIRYVVSGGDAQAVQNARSGIIYAVVGLILAFAAYAIINFVVDQIGPGEEPPAPQFPGPNTPI